HDTEGGVYLGMGGCGRGGHKARPRGEYSSRSATRLDVPAAIRRVASMISKVLVKNPVERPKTAANAPPEAPLRPKRRWRGLLTLALLATAAGAAYYFVPWETVSLTSIGTLLSGGKPPQAPPPRPIPVVAVAARVGDMNLNLNGLGSVTP